MKIDVYICRKSRAITSPLADLIVFILSSHWDENAGVEKCFSASA
jgi:hypothetical protein